MHLTPDEEALMLSRFELWLRKTVITFAQNKQPPNFDDIIQEARIAFVQHIRVMETEAEVYLCKRQIHHAIFEHAREMALVHISQKSFTSVRGSVKRAAEEELAKVPVDPQDDEVLTKLAFQRFFDQLTPTERTAVEMKSQGCSNIDIMRTIGANNEMQVSRMLKRLRTELHAILYTD